MAFDSAQEKTEAPTPRRREEARASGQIGRSTDLNAALTLLGALIILHVVGRDMLGRLLAITRECLGAGAETIEPDQMVRILGVSLRDGAVMVLPVLLGVLVLALVSALGQVGLLFTFKPLKPSLDKLNPLRGLKNMFSARAFIMLAMGVAKMLLLSLVAYWTLRDRMDLLAALPAMSHLSVVAVASELIFTLGLRLAIVLLVLAILDFIWQRYKTERDLRMTKDEVKEEIKRMDGDPKLKARRRQIQLQMAIQRIRAAVPRADVVVTNPTEFAVALQYDNRTMTAPRVTAKGADYLAKQIRELAILHGVPIVERPPLARALYHSVEVGREVPAQFYQAVAEVLAYVYELAGRRPRRQAAPEMALN